MLRLTVERHNTLFMIIKHLSLTIIILLSTVHLCDAQQWVYNSSGTETRGSYRYASLTSGATDNLRASSIYVNFYDIDQKYNIYLYEVTDLECSENTLQYFTDQDREPRSFGVASRSDGIETIAMTEIEDLSTFLTSVKSCSELTIRINNNCGTGRNIKFPMDNGTEMVSFMTESVGKQVVEQVSSAPKVQEQVSSESVKSEMSAQAKETKEQISSSHDASSALSGYRTPRGTSISSSDKTESKSAPATMPEDSKNIDAEWARLAQRSRELDRKDSLLVLFQSQLDERELALIQQEQDLTSRATQVHSQPTASYSAPLASSPAPIVQTTSYPYRYVQFIATSAVNNYDRLSYIGQIVTEQIPGRNTIRYKVMGQWSDADIARVKNELSQEGFQGAFESK